ncbi:hypothetical protein BK754_17755 [Bacillus thuringiensis serovar subtoxicus]|uniref:Uncharacterized protein n=1 Tax=Bacillus thuringiensis serovar subtoxicus TaxID=475791 RepID=A0A9X6FJ86_BACTU|nr:hypothetical protein [Bacillus thuringiensis]OTY92898.1 hypothetical protein BK754_17755 [Bacillus thuringiensis serovar subtoxicus]
MKMNQVMINKAYKFRIYPHLAQAILGNKVNVISLLSSEGFIVPSERNFVLTCNKTAHFFVLRYFKIWAGWVCIVTST